VKETILSISSPFGPSIDLLKFSWKGKSHNETISIVSGLYGNQLNGIYLCSRLTHFLDSVEAGKEPNYYLRGLINIIPAVNIPAIQEGQSLWSFNDLDTNLTFPGNEHGEISERIAATVYQHTKNSQFGIILKSANKHYDDAPHLSCLNPDRLTKNFANSLGPKFLRGTRNSTTLQLSLYKQWLEEMSAVVLSAGKPNHLDQSLCETLFSGLINSLLWAGVLGNDLKKPIKYQLQFNKEKNEEFIISHSGGFFLPAAKLGTEIETGQKIGDIVDLYSGVIIESLLSQSSGYLISLRDYPIIYEKEVLAIILNKSKLFFWSFK
jgi:predicted deacylase